MSAKKAAPPSPSKIGRLVAAATGKGAVVFGILAIAAILAGGWFFVWGRVHEHVLASPDYRLDPRNITLTAPPRWIHADVKAEVIRDASFDQTLSILEPDLTVRIAQAFALHPWIQRVNRVSKKHPASVEVDVEYREPVAMVEVSGGLLPVDREGVLLPSDDFSPAAARNYPRISGVNSEPVGPVGTNWGDTHVVGAAKVAAVCAPHWQVLRLYRVVAMPRLAGSVSASEGGFELYTHAGTQIVWGHAPGKELPSEMPSAEKIRQLVGYAQEKGSLDPPTGSQRIDLRSGKEFIVTPRTALRSPPDEATE